MKKIFILCCASLYAFTLQACSTPPPVNNDSSSTNSSDSVMPKEFGDRFSSEKIKQKREAIYAQKLMELKHKDPIRESNTAIQNNNIYLMAIPAGRGVSRSFPGLSETQIQHINCNIQLVEGLGDVLYGKNHLAYRNELQDYMRRFNVLMAPHCQS